MIQGRTTNASRSFNGAAPVKERKTIAASAVTYAKLQLQWGRSGEGAEDSERGGPLSRSGVLLQWGRSGEGAEDTPWPPPPGERYWEASMGPLR